MNGTDIYVYINLFKQKERRLTGYVSMSGNNHQKQTKMWPVIFLKKGALGDSKSVKIFYNNLRSQL